MQISHIAGYKFLSLNETETLRQHLLAECEQQSLKGTILLSTEGINLSLAGLIANIAAFKRYLQNDHRFADITFHESYSLKQPFKRLKIKLKKEIITLREPAADPTKTRAPHVDPATLKQWLDENRNITLLDTRNDYEVRFGTFKNALNLHLQDFSQFPDASKKVAKTNPIVMFCTGGIRCEKAALYLLDQGYSDVYQLDGGILGYFAEVGGAHYEGECFVFDERVAVDAQLKETHTLRCKQCDGPVKQNEQLGECSADIVCAGCRA